MFKIISLFTLLLLLSCSQDKVEKEQKENAKQDPLPSWNDGKSKKAIIDFVEKVTDKNNDSFVEPKDRIATFDNDGTLCSEQPLYFQLIFVIDEIKKMSADHPEWKSTQPFQAVLEDDKEALLAQGEKGLIQLLLATHSNMSTEEFEQNVLDWINTSKHPKFDRKYSEMVYQPMLELLDYLRANEFQTYIVSGGGIEFMRPWAEEVYGIPRNQIIGSSLKANFEKSDSSTQITKTAEIDFIDDKEGKPVAIQKHIGRKPIFAAGNSDGDLQMLLWAESNSLPSFMLYVHHTDEKREWAYDRESHIGKFDQGLDEANEKGWTIVDMKKEWKVIYPFEK